MAGRYNGGASVWQKGMMARKGRHGCSLMQQWTRSSQARVQVLGGRYHAVRQLADCEC